MGRKKWRESTRSVNHSSKGTFTNRPCTASTWKWILGKSFKTTDFFDWLNRTYFIIHCHNGNQNRFFAVLIFSTHLRGRSLFYRQGNTHFDTEFFNCSAVSLTAGCSTPDMIVCGYRNPWFSSIVPLSTQLFPSVPPDVKYPLLQETQQSVQRFVFSLVVADGSPDCLNHV